MLFESTRILLRGIVQSIENGENTTWDDHLESGIQCLYELHQMSRPASRAYKIDPKSHGGGPVSDRAIHAIPHVKLMVSAIRRKDQPAALQAGRAAVVEMNGFGGIKLVRPAEPVVAAPVVAAPVAMKAPEVVPSAPRPKPAKKAAKAVSRRQRVVVKPKPKRLARAAGR
jgi:hypothetical protein